MKRSNLERRTPIAKKARRKKRIGPRCNWPGYACRKEARVIVSEFERYCKGHALEVADKLVGDFVKERDHWTCQLVGFNAKPCGGPLAWCHVIPKGRYQSLRFEPDNSLAGCRDHHAAFDSSEIERRRFAIYRLGEDRLEELQEQAVTTTRPPLPEVIEFYRRQKENA